MKKPKIKPSYIARCRNYMQWIPAQDGDTLHFLRIDRSIPDSGDGEFSAVEAMFIHETHGRVVSCSEPYFLACLTVGKASREFHIKGWLSMTRACEAHAEEFFGCLGLRSAEEFRSIFGRSLTLPLLRIIHRGMGEMIFTYEGMYNSSEPSATLLVAT